MWQARGKASACANRRAGIQARQRRVLFAQQGLMTVLAPITCDVGGCRKVAVNGARYCADHNRPLPQQAEENQAHERQRTHNEPWRKWYHRVQWVRLRGLCLARDPVCKICNRNASTIADHKVPHKGAWVLFCDLNNLQGVCKPCHDLKTATEDGGFGSRPIDSNVPVVTGDTGKQYSSSSVG